MRSRRDGGFTLIELLVVMVILSILAVIAIPTFMEQRKKAWARAAQADVRHGAIQAEMYFEENLTYDGLDPATMRASEGDVLSVSDADVDGYCLEADHQKLQPAPDYHFDQELGRPVQGACAPAAPPVVP
ncbi:MAG TPA: type II secretion system protein [Mycobacteriales bacterium]